jgi:hypothetical protein
MSDYIKRLEQTHSGYEARLAGTVGIMEKLAAECGDPRAQRYILRAVHMLKHDYRTGRERKPKTREAALAHEEAKKARNRAAAKRAGNHHQQWTTADDELVLHSPGLDSEIAEQLGRSILAVRARRRKLMKAAA